jgi:hypothetical protein
VPLFKLRILRHKKKIRNIHIKANNFSLRVVFIVSSLRGGVKKILKPENIVQSVDGLEHVSTQEVR